MPEKMNESSEEESVDLTNSRTEDEGDVNARKAASTGARLWDRVRSSLLRPKVQRRG